MNLSPNFTLDELTHSDLASRKGWDNTPNTQEMANLKRLANFLEAVRTIIGKPIYINSGYRSKILNDAVGSNDKSHHRHGCAADIRVTGMTPREVVQKLIASGLAYEQVIQEFSTPQGGGWTHIAITLYEIDKPCRQALIIDKQGVRPFA
jgi:hypothetical protein